MTDYFFPIFVMGTSCVALSIKNIKTRVSREMTSRTKMGGTLPSTGMWQGEVFAISDCLVVFSMLSSSVIHHGSMLKVITCGRTAPADLQLQHQ